jgi:hypothetical protein
MLASPRSWIIKLTKDLWVISERLRDQIFSFIHIYMTVTDFISYYHMVLEQKEKSELISLTKRIGTVEIKK